MDITPPSPGGVFYFARSPIVAVTMKIEQLGEFNLIERIQRALPGTGPGVLVGIGDDVAVLESAAQDGRVWLVTCDVQVEGSHFLRSAILPRDLGRKALAINQSDIAATGGVPRFALVSLGLPGDLEVEFVDELYAGLREQALAFDTQLVGGNLSRSRLGIFIDIFLIGEAPRADILLRSGARPGDRILVTGTLGDAAAGVALLLNSQLTTSAPYARLARTRLNLPTPRVREGQLIGASHQATAMLDVSDGLASDLGHICERSEVGARLVATRLPVANENRALAPGNEWQFALFGGEDYELLFTAPADAAGSLAASITHATGTRVSDIGEIMPASAGRTLVLPDGGTVPLDAGGWDHFKQ